MITLLGISRSSGHAMCRLLGIQRPVPEFSGQMGVQERKDPV